MLSQKLHAPIAWSSNDPDINRFLDRLQGNILKYHGRDDVVFLFCRFRDDSKPAARAFMAGQVSRMISARQQLQATAAAKRPGGRKDPNPFVAVFLSKPGYDYFGIPAARQPADPAFQAGMPATKQLGDTAPATWDSRLRNPHALILVAVDSADHAQTEATDLLTEIGGIADVATGRSGSLLGNQFFNAEGRGVENFGYVDGRSQPLVLQEDIDAGGTQELPNAGFPVDQFVVRDPATDDPDAYGSYFVFRQLEQLVRAFKHREDLLTEGRDDFPNRDSAAVGRLESGTPFELRPDDGTDDHKLEPDETNNFTFTTDPPGCPHFAHIRKVNPRTDGTRSWIMIRRGMTYGTRGDAIRDAKGRLVLAENTPADQLPVDGVGLLFQSYQADIRAQFETTQIAANDPAGGIDPVIGQAKSALLNWPVTWRGAATEPTDFYSRDGHSAPLGPYVKLRGGGYFFAPSLPFLQACF